MYIYFNKLGELTTIIPHGEIVRQGTWFTLNVALDKDTDMSNLNMWFRFKRRGNERFVGDENYQGHFDMIKSGIQTFHKVEPKEATFDLVDGQDYAIFTYKVSTDTGLTAIDGNVEIVFTLTEQVTNEDGQQVTEDVKMQGRANIYVEPTYGLHPERGLDLSVSEYATIMQTINQLQNSLKVTNITIEESENAVKDAEYNVTVTYNDKSTQTFRSMYLEQYLSSASVDTDNMQLTITESHGTKLIFEGLNAKKVMEVVNANSILGEATIVLKKSTDDGIQLNSENQAMTNNGIYKYFGGYLIRLESNKSGSLTSEQYKILSKNNNAVLSMNGNIYTLSKFINGKIYYHHISGSAEDFIIVDQDYTWTTDHVTFDVVDLAQQLAELKLDLLSKVDKLQTISQYPKAYVEYTEDGKPVQGSIPVVDDKSTAGSIARRMASGELIITSYFGGSNNSALSVGIAKANFLQKNFISGNALNVVYGITRQTNFDFSKRTPILENKDISSNEEIIQAMGNNETISGLTRLGSIVGTRITTTYENGTFKATSQSTAIGIGFKINVTAGTRYYIENVSGANFGERYWIWVESGTIKNERYSQFFNFPITGSAFIAFFPNEANKEMTISGFDVKTSSIQTIFELTDKAIPNTAVKRNSNGSFEVPTPQTDDEVAPKAYVDTKLEKVTIESTLVQLYAKFASGGQGMVSISMDAPRGGTIVQRDGEGKIKTANPVDPTDAVNLQTLESKISTVYKYKGSVDNYSDLPTENNQVGDVYNIVNADPTHDIKSGDNVAWTGTAWDKLGGDIDLSNYVTQDQLSNYAQKNELDTKLDKVTTTTDVYQVYVKAPDGTQTMANISNYIAQGNIVVWGAGGKIKTNTPTENTDCANKKYVDDLEDSKVSKITTADDTERVYAVSETGEQIMIVSTIEDDANTLVRRNEEGCITISKEITHDYEATNKLYVDRALEGKLDKVTTTGGLRAYTINAQGEQTVTSAKASPSIGALVLFNNNRSVTVAETPVEDTDAVSKKYVDSHSPTPVEISLTGTSGTLTDVQYEALSNRLTYLTLSSSEFRRTRTETDTLTYGNFYVTTNGINVEEIKISTTNKTWTYTSKVAQFKIEVGVTTGDKVELKID